jgi:hypothetical protein
MAKKKPFCVVRKHKKGAYAIPFGDAGWRIVRNKGKRVSLSTVTKEARAMGYRVDFRKVSSGSTLICYK